MGMTTDSVSRPRWESRTVSGLVAEVGGAVDARWYGGPGVAPDGQEELVDGAFIGDGGEDLDGLWDGGFPRGSGAGLGADAVEGVVGVEGEVLADAFGGGGGDEGVGAQGQRGGHGLADEVDGVVRRCGHVLLSKGRILREKDRSPDRYHRFSVYAHARSNASGSG